MKKYYVVMALVALTMPFATLNAQGGGRGGGGAQRRQRPGADQSSDRKRGLREGAVLHLRLLCLPRL